MQNLAKKKENAARFLSLDLRINLLPTRGVRGRQNKRLNVAAHFG